MKDLIKSLFFILAASSLFMLGFYLGEEKVKSKISNFQEDLEGK